MAGVVMAELSLFLPMIACRATRPTSCPSPATCNAPSIAAIAGGAAPNTTGDFAALILAALSVTKERPDECGVLRETDDIP
jgi:hypothetical protein